MFKTEIRDYIPPIHAPQRFLEQMFGPGVSEAVAAYRSAPRDPELAGLLCLFGSTEMIVARWRRQGDWVAGADDKGVEVVRVPAREPVHVRAAFDSQRQIMRTNCP